MKILIINVVCGIKSTGRICSDISNVLEKEGHEVVVAYGRDNPPINYQGKVYRIDTKIDVFNHILKARLFDGDGFGSAIATRRFISWIKKYNPDVIHLHNLHGYYINIRILFNYLKKCEKKIVWTLHDCWAFTGHCTYFDYASCEKWQYGCGHCQQKREYPKSLFLDQSKRHYKEKKKLFSNINNLVIVTPSRWLANLVKNSYLSDYQIEVINNGIDKDIFCNRGEKFRIKNELGSKIVILGVASIWNRRKGLEYFLELNKLINNNYKIVLVGLSEQQQLGIPSNIVAVKRTNSPVELAEIYSAADVFLNPTLEDNYPTTNLEAISCGTPVISFDTGGSGESAKIYGNVVKKGDINRVISIINGMLYERNGEKINSHYDAARYYLEVYNK